MKTLLLVHPLVREAGLAVEDALRDKGVEVQPCSMTEPLSPSHAEQLLQDVWSSAGEVAMVFPPVLSPRLEEQLLGIARLSVGLNVAVHAFVHQDDWRNSRVVEKGLAPRDPFSPRLLQIAEKAMRPMSIQLSDFRTPSEAASSAALRMGGDDSLELRSPAVAVCIFGPDIHGLSYRALDVCSPSEKEGEVQRVDIVDQHISHCGPVATLSFVASSRSDQGIHLPTFKRQLQVAFTPKHDPLKRHGRPTVQVLPIKHSKIGDLYRSTRRSFSVEARCEGGVPGKERELVKKIYDAGASIEYARVRPFTQEDGTLVNNILITVGVSALSPGQVERLENLLEQTDLPFLRKPSVRRLTDRTGRSTDPKGTDHSRLRRRR